MRCRVVNRCFAADEGQPAELMRTLDQSVTVIDPREAEAAFSRDFKTVRTMEDLTLTAIIVRSVDTSQRKNERTYLPAKTRFFAASQMATTAGCLMRRSMVTA
jgi:hypothetical protein